jgi:hypothetical protein
MNQIRILLKILLLQATAIIQVIRLSNYEISGPLVLSLPHGYLRSFFRGGGMFMYFG